MTNGTEDAKCQESLYYIMEYTFSNLVSKLIRTKAEVELDLTMSEVVLVNAKAERLHKVNHM
jgi:hypothetical protein